jgi:hypothetical protein
MVLIILTRKGFDLYGIAERTIQEIPPYEAAEQVLAPLYWAGPSRQITETNKILNFIEITSPLSLLPSFYSSTTRNV